MLPRNTNHPHRNTEQHQNNPGGPENSSTASENVIAAHEQADKDIQQDPEFSVQSANDDLDEGETARLGEDRTDLV